MKTLVWNMEPKYLRRRRVAFALAVVVVAFAIWGLFQVSTSLWWVGNGYCWGEMTECYFGEGK